MRRVSTLIALVVLAAACGSTSAPSLTALATPTPAPEPTAPPTATPAPTPTPTPIPTPTRVPTPTPVPDCLPDIGVRVLLGQLLFPLASPAELPLIEPLAAARAVSGVVLLGAPTLEELRAIPDEDAAGVPLIVASDEEGGRVQRLGHLFGPLPSARQLAAGTSAEVADTFATYGAQLVDAGVAMAIAPVIDVGSGPGIGDRSFADDPELVAEYGAAVIAGYRSAGVIPVIKHFPGHGSASADSHLTFSTTPPVETLSALDLLPFRELLDDAVPVLVGHLLVPGLTEDMPTSLSPAAIDGLLRRDLGFQGVVITDALGMNAISNRWDNAEAARLAIAAGADLVVLDTPALVTPVLDALEAAVAAGTLDIAQVRASAERVLTLKAIDPCRLA